MIAIVQHLKMSEVDPNSLPEDSLAKKRAIAEKDVLMMQRVSMGEDAAMAFLVDRWKGPLVRFFNRSLQQQMGTEIAFSGSQSCPFMVRWENEAVGPVAIMRHKASPGAAADEWA